MKKEWLIEIRKNKRLTTYSAAKLCGISQSLYWSIENNQRGVSVATAKKIANAMGFNWTFFFGDNGNEN